MGKKKEKLGNTRRDFLKTSAAVAAFTIVPRHVLGGAGQTAPCEKLNIAGIGVGGMGGANINACGNENIVALCDVDEEKAANIFNKYPNAKKYKDFRKMLEKEKNIDAVVIATPDHTHAVATMAAIQMGKHVYTQKPMAHTIHETRRLTKAAREAKVMTQMGNQGHSEEGIRLICEWIWDGAIGPVREVHAWTNRPVWPQGIGRPKDTPPVPETLDWDLWLGPAPERPYNPAYHPFKWRGWWDFGTGALGDMACHVLDPVFWALKLKYPKAVFATATIWNSNGLKIVNEETFPLASTIYYEFDAREDMPPVTVTWYDGGLLPPRPAELEAGRQMGDNSGGVLFIGDKGKLVCGSYGNGPRLIPEERMQEYKRPPKTIERIEGSHEQNWINACKSGKQACSNFDCAGPFTEMVLLGSVALRTCRIQGRTQMRDRLEWDGPNIKVTNVPEADKYIHKEYRQGWTL